MPRSLTQSPSGAGDAGHDVADDEASDVDDFLRRVAHAPPVEHADVALRVGLPVVGDRVDGRYEIEEVLGEGGMGVVFGAKNLRTDACVALKFMNRISARSQAARDRFEREARIASTLRHPNVVRVFDVGSHEGCPYIVMERLYGRSLAEPLREGPLARAEAVRITLAVARGVAQAHSLGVIHRDLKPANIFLAQEPHTSLAVPKLLDFGISRLVERSEELATLTRSGVTIGTPAYMPLEQLRGGLVDRRSDVYSLGVILFQALTGALPFETTNHHDQAVRMATERPRSVSSVAADVPPALDAVVSRALALNPADRHSDAGAFADALLASSLPSARARFGTLRKASIPLVLVFGVTVGMLVSSGQRLEPASGVAPAKTPSQPQPTNILDGEQRDGRGVDTERDDAPRSLAPNDAGQAAGPEANLPAWAGEGGTVATPDATDGPGPDQPAGKATVETPRRVIRRRSTRPAANAEKKTPAKASPREIARDLKRDDF